MSASSSSLSTLHIPTPWASEILRCLTKCRNQSLIKIALPKWSPHEYLCRTMKKDFMRRILNVLVIFFPQKLDICQFRHFGNIVKLIWIFIIRLPASPNCQKSRYKTRKSNFKKKHWRIKIEEWKMKHWNWWIEIEGGPEELLQATTPRVWEGTASHEEPYWRKGEICASFFVPYFLRFSSIAYKDGRIMSILVKI